MALDLDGELADEVVGGHGDAAYRRPSGGRLDLRGAEGAARAPTRGMSLRHSGHLCVSSSTSSPVFMRAISALTGLTTKKNTTAAMIRNVSSALMKWP